MSEMEPTAEEEPRSRRRRTVSIAAEDDDIPNIVPTTASTTGDTPIRRASPSLISPSGSGRPGSASRGGSAGRQQRNQHNRTPNRFESPLGAGASFRREAAASNEGQRVTVRPLAGAAVGSTIVSRRVSTVFDFIPFWGHLAHTHLSLLYRYSISQDYPRAVKQQQSSRDTF